MDRPYFYKDENGALRRYQYCTFCGKGPFTEKDKSHGICFFRGSGNQPTITCRSCDMTKFPKMERMPLIDLPDLPIKAPEVLLPIEPVEEFPKVIEPLKEESPEPKSTPVSKLSQVMVGQIWKDKDKRRERTVTLTQVRGRYAYYMGGKNGNIKMAITVKRLKARFILL